MFFCVWIFAYTVSNGRRQCGMVWFNWHIDYGRVWKHEERRNSTFFFCIHGTDSNYYTVLANWLLLYNYNFCTLTNAHRHPFAPLCNTKLGSNSEAKPTNKRQQRKKIWDIKAKTFYPDTHTFVRRHFSFFFFFLFFFSRHGIFNLNRRQRLLSFDRCWTKWAP